MPINGTELYAGAKLRQWHMTQESGDDPAPGDQPAQQVEPMQARQQVEETVGWIAGDKVAPGDKLLPDPELPRQKGNGKDTPNAKPMTVAPSRALRAAMREHCSAMQLITRKAEFSQSGRRLPNGAKGSVRGSQSTI